MKMYKIFDILFVGIAVKNCLVGMLLTCFAKNVDKAVLKIWPSDFVGIVGGLFCIDALILPL